MFFNYTLHASNCQAEFVVTSETFNFRFFVGFSERARARGCSSRETLDAKNRNYGTLNEASRVYTHLQDVETLRDMKLYI